MSNGNIDTNNNHFNSPEGISIKEYVNDKFNNLEKAIDARFDSVTQTTNSALASADKAITKSDVAIEKRLDSVNEFRNTLSDQQRTFIPRAELEVVIQAINDKINSLNMSTIARQSEGVGQKQGMGYIAIVAGIVSSIIGVLMWFLAK